MKRFGLSCLLILMAAMSVNVEAKKAMPVRLLYWNILQGMWDGQADNYDRFVNWIKAQSPDICVWCEAESNWKTGEALVRNEKPARYLPNNWPELAARYGHNYTYLGMHRDGFPQVITSRYPIENVNRIGGDGGDSLVCHGAGHAKVCIAGHDINIVTVHTWPQRYAYKAADPAESARQGGGHHYRRMEMEYICNNTVNRHPAAGSEWWMMLGDFNAESSFDNFHYGMPRDTAAFLLHDYINDCTPYLDVMHYRHPKQYCPSYAEGKYRMDFLYCTRPLYDCVKSARFIVDDYTTPRGLVKDGKVLKNYWVPSDHLPLLVDFEIKK